MSEQDFSFSHDPRALRLSLKLVARKAVPGEEAALCCRGREIDWLSRICRRLPAPLFRAIQFAGNRDFLFLQLPAAGDGRFFPFARPLRRLGKRVYLPWDRDFSPALEPRILEETLGLAPDRLCFIGDDFRFDIELRAFRPLFRALFNDDLPQVNIVPAPAETLLFTSPDPDPEAGPDANIETAANAATGSPPPKTTAPGPEAGPQALLQAYALQLRCENDFLGAATCFSLAGENHQAAECYRLAALKLQST